MVESEVNKMRSIKRSGAKEHRIEMEIVVDAYDEWERAMGWYYYLEDRLSFPFKAKCIRQELRSPLKKGDVVEVTAMAPEKECEYDMFVEIQWEKRKLAVSLSQLEGISIDGETKQAIEDWHYWVARDYKF